MYKVLIIVFIFYSVAFSQEIIQGKVTDENNSPLIGANIFWAKTESGTTTDAEGKFRIKKHQNSDKLIFSYIGYYSDTITVKNTDVVLNINLKPHAHETKDINVTAERPSMEIDYLGVENTTKINQKELFKAACCNLSESFETNPSIDVSFTDAVTGTKQIEMLGLSGIYTQTTMENLPFIRGFLSNIGLTFIPGTWLNAIYVSKGVGSVVNGYESMTGQIDVDLQKPHGDEENPFLINLYGDYDQRFEGNLNYRLHISEQLAAMNLLHWSSRQHKADINSDNFSDMPTTNSVNLMQRWQYFSDLGWESQFGFQYVKDKKRGGTISQDNSGYSNYVYENNNEFINLFAKTGYVFPDEHHKSFGFQLSYNRFNNDSKFGLKDYSGKQNSFYFNFIYQSFFIEEIHSFKTGLSFLFDDFNEIFNNQLFKRTERVPGAFFEYSFTPEHYFSLVAGLRVDKHNYFNTMITPRLHIRYEITEDWVLKAAAGRGYRTSNILTEHSSSFISSRSLEILKQNDFGYGLEQEVALNFGLNLTRYFIFNYQDATISVDFYRTYFENVVIPNLDKSTKLISFSSIKNGAYSNSIQAELNMKLIPPIDLRLAYRYLDVKQLVNDNWMLRPFTSKNRALLNLGIEAYKSEVSDSKFLIDFTLQWFGEKRIPNTSENPVEFRRNSNSPAFILINSQLTYTVLQGLDIYLGGENLLDFKQSDPIIDPQNPSGQYFDGSLIWGPVNGRMIYSGIRMMF